MTEFLVQHVEEFCDIFERDIPPEYSLYGKTISIPASVAALRAFYYVEKNTLQIPIVSQKLAIYESMRLVLTDSRCRWSNLTLREKQALLTCIEAHKVLVVI